MAELAGWGVREGLLFPQRDDPSRWRSAGAASPYLRRAWEESGARRGVWAPEGRGNARPDHAFRAGFQSALKRAGADDEAVAFLVGHALPGTRANYVAAETGTPWATHPSPISPRILPHSDV